MFINNGKIDQVDRHKVIIVKFKQYWFLARITAIGQYSKSKGIGYYVKIKDLTS
jgi:hypothetical protein